MWSFVWGWGWGEAGDSSEHSGGGVLSLEFSREVCVGQPYGAATS